jgi:hypothetical protein
VQHAHLERDRRLREREGPRLPAGAARGPSPGVGPDGQTLLRDRARALPVVEGKHACHSDHVPDAERARAVQMSLAQRGKASAG